VRSGVTAILPPAVRPKRPSPVYAGIHRFNGNGEMTGSHWIEDGGFVCGSGADHQHPRGRHRAIMRRSAGCWSSHASKPTTIGDFHLWLMPVVAETYDGVLSDINGHAGRRKPMPARRWTIGPSRPGGGRKCAAAARA
jgi:D-aminopeptidase